MSAWRGEECRLHLRGTTQQPEPPIPVTHFVERKPEPLGMEVKTTADGLCSAIMLGEIALPAKGYREELEFEGNWGFTTALNIRLVKLWLNTQRVVGADAHFLSINAVEAKLLEMRASMHRMDALL
eukprot:4437032-Pleurochrysis_carterae.AAC.1